MARVTKTGKVRPMPPIAKRAALETYARIINERHPGIVVVPLGPTGGKKAIAAAAAGQIIIRPFAKSEDHDALIEGRASACDEDDRCFD